MNISQILIAISIVTLAVIALLIFYIWSGRQEIRLTPLTILAFGFVLTGMMFSSDRLIGYGLMGIGVLIAGIDAYIKLRSK